jgi:hypothetical protein
MRHAQTSTIGGAAALSLQDVTKAIEAAFAQPRYIGELHGFPVYIDQRLASGTIEVRDARSGEVKLRFSVGHPHIQGTAIERAARAAMCGAT